jgi:glutathione synthase/RimK-type ligase-like ATP-grasp enzyme
LIRAELEKLGADVVWFDTDDYRTGSDVIFAIEGGTPRVTLRIGGREHDGDEIGAVLFRHIRLPTAPLIADAAARRMAESELRATLEGGLFALEPSLWMNHPNANRVTRSKLLQLRLAARLGFKTPETRVTADPTEIRGLYHSWNGEMVAKLAGGQIVGETIYSQYIIFTTPVTPEYLADAGALAACPAIYQRRVAKQHELRVTVVGDEIFACRIDSQAREEARVDWRAAGYTALDHQPCELDASTADRCRVLLRTLGLETAGLDFIVTPEGETVFLEINAAGQWAWVEQETGMPIAAAIARRLAGAAQGGGVRQDPAP